MYNIMEFQNIILFVIIFILIIIVINYVFRDVNTLSGLVNGTTMQTISVSDLDISNANSSNFTYSIWFYIDDWNYRFGEPKVTEGQGRFLFLLASISCLILPKITLDLPYL